MNPVARAFRDAVPGLAVQDDAALAEALSADLATPAPMPAGAVLQPGDVGQVQALVRVARAEGIALVPRGGGWSYTGGTVAPRAPAAVVDMTGLTGITIRRDAAEVEVGAGTTWAALHAALEAEGLRACAFGPLSGTGATVGGGAAQNGGFFGASGHGAWGDGPVHATRMVDGTAALVDFTLADRVRGLEAPQPLVGDCGAFGLRTRVTLATMPLPAATGFVSFEFAEGAAALAALVALRDLPGLGELFLFDPANHRNLARAGFSVMESAGIAGDLLRARGSWWERLSGLLHTARAGKTFVADLRWSVHLSLDGSDAAVAEAQREARRRARALGGHVIPDIIPRVTRSRPFRRIKALLGPSGKLWLPMHGVFSAEAAPAGLAATERVLAEHAEPMRRHGIHTVLLCSTMGARVIVEPQIFWPDAMGPLHRRLVPPEQWQAHGARPANPEARAAAMALRHALIEAFDAAGASHFQIGRSYAAHPGVPAGTREAWAVLKRRHDPDGIMNPGALGL
ncbi:FAD-binding oxidoreductase [Roseomonas haemaphysalidis]|uniref:FAD-binding oxidoreductase n=1 Tax=Roseomonas haemaphysalidis TaxID=2768162 RepID=A0ABS3KT94_9PROT|nr:FAD-binding protein [Roseomonas haemaphysalidis]MBO1080699.1 FAD-binding oxidoreductase [Roseomonas haemaphysalidis]